MKETKRAAEATAMSGAQHAAALSCGMTPRHEPAMPCATGTDEKPVPMRGSFVRALRAEALKSKHAAPLRLAIVLALPFPLLAVLGALLAPQAGLTYAPWNYWYALLMPVAITLAAASVARADARLGNRALLSSGVPLRQAWGAKVVWCLILSALSNLVVFAVYAAASIAVPQGAASMPAMLAAALALIVASSWMVPTTLFLTMRAGMLAGVFVPLAVQIALAFSWSVVPFWPACPPSATIMLPTAFLPVLPSGEPVGVGMDIVETVSQGDAIALALGIACALTAVLVVAGASWFEKSEELR